MARIAAIEAFDFRRTGLSPGFSASTAVLRSPSANREYEFWLDGATTRQGPGSSIFLPRGVPHTFRVVGDRPGRSLAILTPRGFEEFFVEITSRKISVPDNMAEVVDVAIRYGLEFIGPAEWRD